MVRLMRDDVLPFAAVVPSQFLVSVMVLLNRGSLHSAQHESLGTRLRGDGRGGSRGSGGRETWRLFTER